MKSLKIASLFLSAALILCLFAGCGKTGQKDTTVINIGGLKGPTTMGMVKLMEDCKDEDSDINCSFTVAAAADELTPGFIKGELDVIGVPANLASVLYNRTEGQTVLLAINTLGVLYMVEKGDSVSSVQDLKGKTIYATGKGTTPEYALRYVLTSAGIDPDKDVTIEWKSEATEVVGVLSKSDTGIAMLPQPFVTVAQTSIPELRIALDMTEQWDKVGGEGKLVTGVLVARKAFVEEHPSLVKKLLEKYAESTEYVNENPEQAATLIENVGIVKAAVAKKAIPYCNICCITGSGMKQAVSGYLGVLYSLNPAAVGGNLPENDFYYEGK